MLKRLSDPRDSAGASLAVRLKDLELALDLARRHQANLELATCAAERFGHRVARHGPEFVLAPALGAPGRCSALLVCQMVPFKVRSRQRLSSFTANST